MINPADIENTTLNYSYNYQVDRAYIIRLRGNPYSESSSAVAAESCERVGMPYQFWDAVDFTQGIRSLDGILSILKLTNTFMTKEEVGCFLSHFSLWMHCVQLDRPIVVLEHDAIMLKPYLEHPHFNAVAHLGTSYQIKQGKASFPFPVHGQVNENFRFLYCAHAYAIDQFAARNAVARVISKGIYAPADIFFRVEDFCMLQTGMYAIDRDTGGQTTLPKEDLSREDLKYRVANTR